MARERRGASDTGASIKTMIVQDVLYAKEKQMLQMISRKKKEMICEDSTLKPDVVQRTSFAYRRFWTQALLNIDAVTLLHAGSSPHKRFCTQTLLHTDAFTHKRLYTQTLLHKPSIFDNRTSFRAKGWPRTPPLVILPQLLTLAPGFARKCSHILVPRGHRPRP